MNIAFCGSVQLFLLPAHILKGRFLLARFGCGLTLIRFEPHSLLGKAPKLCVSVSVKLCSSIKRPAYWAEP